MATPTIGGNPDPAQIANTTNSVIRDVQAMQDVQVFKDDTGTRRVLMGRGPNGFYGMKVSQEGNDVYDATNDQLVFNSDNNLFKIVSSGTVVILGGTCAAEDGFYSENRFEHGLGYAPLIIAYSISGSGTLRLFGGFKLEAWGGSAGLGYHKIQRFSREGLHSTSTEVAFYRSYDNAETGSVSVDAITVKYYLLQETAN